MAADQKIPAGGSSRAMARVSATRLETHGGSIVLLAISVNLALFRAAFDEMELASPLR